VLISKKLGIPTTKQTTNPIKAAFAGVHGAGEAIRGTFNSAVDGAFNEVGFVFFYLLCVSVDCFYVFQREERAGRVGKVEGNGDRLYVSFCQGNS
jgi:hypothetical protein